MKVKSSIKLKRTLASVCILAASGMAHAETAPLNLTMPASNASARPFMVASNDAAANLPASVTRATPVAEFEPPMFSGDKLHQYLGLTTIALAGLAALTAPGEGCEANCGPAQPRQVNGTHAKIAKAAGAMAAATIASGLIDHWDDFHLEDGFADPDNLHALLGTTGALAMMYAINKSAAGTGTQPVSHAGIAELGAVAMVVAVKLTW